MSDASSAPRTGVVLAGGYSTRFGDRDKALAAIDGDPMLVRVVRRLASVVDEVVVSCRADQHEEFEREIDGLAAPTPVRFVHDSTPDMGPLAGIKNAFEGTESEITAVVACDMPWVDPAFLSALFDRVGDAEALVPEHPDGHLQPTQAVYRTAAMRQVAGDQLAAGNRSVHRALDQLDMTVLSAATVADLSDTTTLRDVNTVAERDAYEGTSE
jgi:molybdopterin-guanine dinucleotide biosynthesis protein A